MQKKPSFQILHHSEKRKIFWTEYIHEIFEEPRGTLTNKIATSRVQLIYKGKVTNVKRVTYVLQLFFNSCIEMFDGFWAAAWYFCATTPSWLTWNNIDFGQHPFAVRWYYFIITPQPSYHLNSTTRWERIKHKRVEM